jgi:signal transduction histidine kinase/ActR/RegA family two-component response regulator
MCAFPSTAEAQLSGVLDVISDGAYVCDRDGRITYFNAKAVEIWGRTPRLNDPDERYCGAFRRLDKSGVPLAPEACDVAQVLRTKLGVDRRQIVVERADGSRRRVTVQTSPLRDEQGGVSGTVTIFADVAVGVSVQQERDQLARIMLQGHERESLGVLSGGIAHEFNNLLTAILGNAGMARMRTADEELRLMMTDIEAAARRAGALTQQVLACSGRAGSERRRICIQTVLRELRPLLEIAATKNATLSLDLHAAEVECDPAQLRQLVINLVTNSAEALSGSSGHISIRTCHREVAGGQVRYADGRGDFPAGRYAVIEVEDDGCGMSDEVRARIFEPFFTTKPLRHGLGLSAVLDIVKEYRGAVEVNSTVGGGTLVQVWLPLKGFPAGVAEVPLAKGDKAVAPRKILVIDDDELIRSMAMRALERADFRVTCAASGREGLEIFQRERGTWAAIFLDLTMPDLSGREVLTWLREVDASVPVLLTSGFSDLTPNVDFAGMGASGFIAKPFGVLNLIAAMRAVVGNAQPTVF